MCFIAKPYPVRQPQPASRPRLYLLYFEHWDILISHMSVSVQSCDNCFHRKGTGLGQFCGTVMWATDTLCVDVKCLQWLWFELCVPSLFWKAIESLKGRASLKEVGPNVEGLYLTPLPVSSVSWLWIQWDQLPQSPASMSPCHDGLYPFKV